MTEPRRKIPEDELALCVGTPSCGNVRNEKRYGDATARFWGCGHEEAQEVAVDLGDGSE